MKIFRKEDFVAWGRKGGEANGRRLQSLPPEIRKEIALPMQNWWNRLSPEQQAGVKAKRLAGWKKWWATQTGDKSALDDQRKGV